MIKDMECVIFDWAGTTVDYGCFAPVQAFVEIFRHYGIEPSMDEVRKPMGMLKRDHIKAMLSMERIRNLWMEIYKKEPSERDIDAMHDMFQEKLMGILENYAKPKPYVEETVKALRSMGIKIGSTTGYTDQMMELVVPKAAQLGYSPDAWFSPNAVNNVGRPYPYMIFENMKALKISSVNRVIKVGDTISDILEGKNAGVYTIGVIEGSSELGMTQEEYESFSEEEKTAAAAKVKECFLQAGADAVIMNMAELLKLEL
ncbi:MAG: phosphonoacetaldehyde hydrolase [Blautia sp.]|jgi:phosphonoacetaldehyde hydrolase